MEVVPLGHADVRRARWHVEGDAYPRALRQRVDLEETCRELLSARQATLHSLRIYQMGATIERGDPEDARYNEALCELASCISTSGASLVAAAVLLPQRCLQSCVYLFSRVL